MIKYPRERILPGLRFLGHTVVKRDNEIEAKKSKFYILLILFLILLIDLI